MNLFTKQKQTLCGKQTYGYQDGQGERDKLEVWDQIYTTTYIKYKKRTQYIAQGPIFNILQKPIMEKNLKKNVCIYIHTHIYIYTHTNI